MIFMKEKEFACYLTVRSKIFIQSYVARMNWPAEEVKVSFLPLEIIKMESERGSSPLMQIEGRKI